MEQTGLCVILHCPTSREDRSYSFDSSEQRESESKDGALVQSAGVAAVTAGSSPGRISGFAHIVCSCTKTDFFGGILFGIPSTCMVHDHDRCGIGGLHASDCSPLSTMAKARRSGN